MARRSDRQPRSGQSGDAELLERDDGIPAWRWRFEGNSRGKPGVVCLLAQLPETAEDLFNLAYKYAFVAAPEENKHVSQGYLMLSLVRTCFELLCCNPPRWGSHRDSPRTPLRWAV